MAYFKMLPVENIELDIKNPRIAKWVEMYGDVIKPEQMALALGAGSSSDGEAGVSFNSLKQSIQTNQGIIHPIIVNKEGKSKYVVIEGNTRTLIYKEFKEKNIAGNWNVIPAMVYEDMSAQTIDAIRLQAHLVGTRAWDPYSKAKYLDFLRNSENLTYAQIIDFCGGNKKEVEHYIQAYQDMEKYYRPILDSDQDFDHTRFSAFVELQKQTILTGLLEGGFTKTDFSRWVHEKKIYPLLSVRKLPRVLKNEKALKIFQKDDIEEAIKVLDTPSAASTLQDATLIQLAKEISRRIGAISLDQIKKLRDENAREERDIIIDAKENIQDLCNEIVVE
jgi:hypothetical protein